MNETIMTEEQVETDIMEETAGSEASVSAGADVPEEAVTGEAPTEEALEETPSLEEQLLAVQAEAARNLDGWLRAQAELANARKRFEKQRADTYVNATADLVARLLPVMDDFERALNNVPADVAENSWFEGIHLVYRKLNSILEHFNVSPIVAVGESFDPNLHEALSQESSVEHESGTVTRELQKGYLLGDRVIRPALVYVAE